MSAKKYLNEERTSELIDQIERRSPANFVGTTAQWNALTASQKAKYAIVDLVDDGEALGADPVDVVQDGNMHSITSNAVADFLKVKSKCISEGVTIRAGKVETVTDLELANKIFAGYAIYHVAEFSISVTQALIHNSGANVTIKNNGSADITTGQVWVYYLG